MCVCVVCVCVVCVCVVCARNNALFYSIIKTASHTHTHSLLAYLNLSQLFGQLLVGEEKERGRREEGGEERGEERREEGEEERKREMSGQGGSSTVG